MMRVLAAVAAAMLISAAPSPSDDHYRACKALEVAIVQIERNGRYLAASSKNDRDHMAAANEAKGAQGPESILAGFASVIAESADHTAKMSAKVSSDDMMLVTALRKEHAAVCNR